MIAEAFAGGVATMQAAINDQGSFTEYVRSILRSRELVQLGVLMFFGSLGMVANYTYKWLRDELSGSLWHYAVTSHPRRTALSIVTFAGYAVTTVLSPVLDGAGWGVVVNLGLTTGFAIDALVNKADRQAWTDEDRAKRTP